MECLKNIIGISRTDCLCVTDGLSGEQKQDLITSVSGFYLDEIEGAVSIKEVKLLDYCGGFYQMAKDAVTIAKQRFESDIEIALSRQYENARPNFHGDLGRLTYAGFLNKNRPYQFMKIEPNQAGDAVITLNTARVIVNAADTLNVFILAGYEGEIPQVIHTVQVNTTPNIYASIPLPDQRDFPTTVNGQKMNYFIAWQGLETTLPRDNKLSCNCTGGNGWDGYVTLKGGESDSLSLQNVNTNDGYSHGLSVNVQITCKTGLLVCREYNAKNKIAVASAYAILYKANEILNEKILQSPEINRFTLMKRDYLWGKRNHFRAKYDEYLNWLSYEIDVKQSGCFICRENQFIVGNIFG